MEINSSVHHHKHFEECFYCHRITSTAKSGNLMKTRDHIIPASRGGINNKKNYVVACSMCNGLKANLTPDEFANLLVSLLERHHMGISRATLELILHNTREFILVIAPYRDELYKKPLKEADWEPVQLPAPIPRKFEETPPTALKGIDKEAQDWYSNWLKTYNALPEPNFHE